MDHFYLFIRDSQANEGYVRINVDQEACSKANAIDGSISSRAKLHVVQTSLLMHFVTVSESTLLLQYKYIFTKGNERNQIVETLTQNIYAVFNGIDDIKSAEFTGFRGPISEQFKLESLSNQQKRQSRPNQHDGIECAQQSCIIFDFVLTTYSLDMSFNGLTFDDSILFGMKQTALISEKQLNQPVRATKVVRPHRLVVGRFLSVAYMLIAFLTFAITSCYLWFYAPMENRMWKAKECFILGLIAASVYMESETFLYYIQGDGLMYTQVFTVTLLLAYLPFTLLIILTLRCYVVTHYLSRWKTTSYYKIYPVQMAVLLISTIFHDLPEVITLYFYYTRYKPPSFDVRLTTLIQPVLAVFVAFIQLFTQTHGMLQYQRLFASKLTRIIIYVSVLPIILVTPLVKIAGGFSAN